VSDPVSATATLIRPSGTLSRQPEKEESTPSLRRVPLKSARAGGLDAL